NQAREQRLVQPPGYPGAGAPALSAPQPAGKTEAGAGAGAALFPGRSGHAGHHGRQAATGGGSPCIIATSPARTALTAASAWKSPARRSPRPGCLWRRPRTAPRSRRPRRRKRKSSSRFGAWTWAICCFFRSEERRVGKEERFVCEGYQDDELSDSI